MLHFHPRVSYNLLMKRVFCYIRVKVLDASLRTNAPDQASSFAFLKLIAGRFKFVIFIALTSFLRLF